MKKLVLAASLALVSACSSLPDTLKGPFARSSHGATASDAVDQGSTTSPYPADTDQGIF
jgi:starvation-inducible outer membrane lipoprotein